MTSYPARVRERLGPLSRERVDVARMLAEWFATGGCEDRGRPDGQCGICGHQDTRWEFELHNRVTGATITDGGSTCIQKFDEIGVRDADGRETHDAEEKHAILSRILSERVRERNTAIALETVAEVQSRLPNVPPDQWPTAGMELWTDNCARVEAALRGDGRGRGGAKVFPRAFNAFLYAARVVGVGVPAVAFRGIVTFQGRGMEQMLEFRRRPRVFQGILPVLTTQQRAALDRA